jgi:endonuclease YncB( thermonuclease family)
MASHVIALLAASGLLASGSALPNARSADALPTAKVALAKAAAKPSAGCFSAIDGKTLKVTKKNATAKCSTSAFGGNNFAGGSGGGGGLLGGGIVGDVVGGVTAGAVGGAIGGAIAKNDNTSNG